MKTLTLALLISPPCKDVQGEMDARTLGNLIIGHPTPSFLFFLNNYPVAGCELRSRTRQPPHTPLSPTHTHTLLPSVLQLDGKDKRRRLGELFLFSSQAIRAEETEAAVSKEPRVPGASKSASEPHARPPRLPSLRTHPAVARGPARSPGAINTS